MNISEEIKVPLNLMEAEKKLIITALSGCHTMATAATRLGISRHALRRRLKRHGIEYKTERTVREMLTREPL